MSTEDTTAEHTKALQALYTESIKLLTQKIKDGTATAADLSVARAHCKDAGIGSLPTKGSPLEGLAGSLPDFKDDGLGTLSH